MKQLLKRKVGEWSRQIAEFLPAVRPCLSGIGIRAGEACFESHPGFIHFRSRPGFKLCRINENYLSFQLFWRSGDFYEPITRSVLETLAESGDTFLDIGANVGFFSLALGSLKPDLRVLAFEPNPKTYVILHENISLNHLRNVTCEPLAFSDRTGFATLYLSESDMSASLVPHFQPRYTIQTNCISVRTCSLDDYVARNKITGALFIKVDIEGHEEAFFQGARRTLSQQAPDFIAEILHEQEPSFAALLRDFGYSFYRITDEGLIETKQLVHCVRPPFEFLNCLLTRRPKKEVKMLASRIEPAVRKINLLHTSKYFPERYKTQQTHPAAVRNE